MATAGNTNSITELLLSEHSCLLTEGNTMNRGTDNRKLRSLSNPVSGDDHEFVRGYTDEEHNEPSSPFYTLAAHNAFVDESGTVIKPKSGFTRSTRAPGQQFINC